jgi:hypothetical protein
MWVLPYAGRTAFSALPPPWSEGRAIYSVLWLTPVILLVCFLFTRYTGIMYLVYWILGNNFLLIF